MAKAKEVEAELEAMGAELVVQPLTSIRAVDDMDTTEFMAWLESEGVSLVEFDGGSNWSLIKDKDTLVDVPFIIVKVRFNDGDKGKFASVCIYVGEDTQVYKKGDKVIFNDGSSTGVANQLKVWTEKNGRDTGIVCAHGLRRSDYKYKEEQDDGSIIERPAKTYYLA